MIPLPLHPKLCDVLIVTGMFSINTGYNRFSHRCADITCYTGKY